MEKNGLKIGFGHNGKWGEKWPQNGKFAIFDPFLGQFSKFSAIFLALSWWGPKNPFLLSLGTQASLSEGSTGKA